MMKDICLTTNKQTNVHSVRNNSLKIYIYIYTRKGEGHLSPADNETYQYCLASCHTFYRPPFLIRISSTSSMAWHLVCSCWAGAAVAVVQGLPVVRFVASLSDTGLWNMYWAHWGPVKRAANLWILQVHFSLWLLCFGSWPYSILSLIKHIL